MNAIYDLYQRLNGGERVVSPTYAEGIEMFNYALDSFVERTTTEARTKAQEETAAAFQKKKMRWKPRNQFWMNWISLEISCNRPRIRMPVENALWKLIRLEMAARWKMPSRHLFSRSENVPPHS